MESGNKGEKALRVVAQKLATNYARSGGMYAAGLFHNGGENLKLLGKLATTSRDLRAITQPAVNVGTMQYNYIAQIDNLLYASRANVRERNAMRIIDAALQAKLPKMTWETVISWAARNSFWNIVTRLISLGVSPNVWDFDSKTPLIYAIGQNKSHMVDTLLKAGANPNTLDGEGKTALVHAIEKDNEPMVHSLLAVGAKVNSPAKPLTPLMIAVRRGNTAVAKRLVDAGANPNTSPMSDDISASPLTFSILFGKYELVRLLVRAGANMNKRIGPNKQTALMLAIEHHKKFIIPLLIENGANINIRDKIGRTALHYAVEERDVNTIRRLIMARARIVTNRTGQSPIHYAEGNNQQHIVNILERSLNRLRRT